MKCKTCGQAIWYVQLANSTKKGWRHKRPMPNGNPNDHCPLKETHGR